MAPGLVELEAMSEPRLEPIGAGAQPGSAGRLAGKAAIEVELLFEPALRADRW